MSDLRWGRKRHWWAALLGIALLATIAASIFAHLNGHGSTTSAIAPDVTITVAHSRPLGVSDFAPGISLIDNSLDYPFANNDPQAIARVMSLMRDGLTYQNTPLMGWGLPDPWPDPQSAGPTNWEPLDARIHAMVDAGSIPVITLAEAPWWMKGQLQPDGSTQLLTPADEWAPIAYSSRILDNHMNDWMTLVRDVAERYMAPPFNVRYFLVWNELKGYYNPVTNDYDYSTNPGHPNHARATHGYTYMYNRVYQQLLTVAANLNVPLSSVRIGGPYVVMDTWSTQQQSDPSTLVKPYGVFDQRALDALKYWLKHKLGAGFIAVDASGTNKDGGVLASATVSAGKFADIVRWIRSLDNTEYPGAASLPIWLAEWYARPYENWADNNHSAAIKTDAMMEFLKAGGAVALAWGGAATDQSSPRLWTNTTSGGGRALPFYGAYREFKDNFGPGVQLYQATASPPGQVDVVASGSTAMIVNLTATTLTVSLDGRLQTMQPYQIITMRR